MHEKLSRRVKSMKVDKEMTTNYTEASLVAVLCLFQSWGPLYSMICRLVIFVLRSFHTNMYVLKMLKMTVCSNSEHWELWVWCVCWLTALVVLFLSWQWKMWSVFPWQDCCSYGAPGVEFTGLHKDTTAVTQIHFLPGQVSKCKTKTSLSSMSKKY